MCAYLDEDAHELGTVLLWIHLRKLCQAQFSHVLLQLTN